MKKSAIAAFAAVLGWSLLAGVVLTLQAQGDSPIIISSSSLHIESAVPWAQFKAQGNVKSHPQTNRSIPSIDLTVGTNAQTLNIGGQSCQVQVKYGATTLTVATGASGKGLSVATDFTAFQPGSDGNHLDHVNGSQTISSIAVTKAGKNIFQGRPTGAVKIVIHYQ
ncbi:MAG: hypothetical protein ABSH45_11285 [Bryobacteraceae bacterium]|jgi:hypothetical protein